MIAEFLLELTIVFMGGGWTRRPFDCTVVSCPHGDSYQEHLALRRSVFLPNYFRELVPAGNIVLPEAKTCRKTHSLILGGTSAPK